MCACSHVPRHVPDAHSQNLNGEMGAKTEIDDIQQKVMCVRVCADVGVQCDCPPVRVLVNKWSSHVNDNDDDSDVETALRFQGGMPPLRPTIGKQP